MDTISVIGTADCDEAEVESDPWIPLKISWWPRGQRQPLYLRVSGSSGGEVELKIDPANGALVQMVVIDMPPLAEVPYTATSAASRRSAAVLDVTHWSGDGSIRRVVGDLSFVQTERAAEVRFGDTAADWYAQCDGVTVGVSAGGQLVSIGGNP